MPSSTENTVIQVVETLSGFASFVACIAMFSKLKKDKTGSLLNQMLYVLFGIDAVLAVMYGIGRSAIGNHGMCTFQAFIIQWFAIAAMLWMVLLSYQMYHWIVLRKHPKRMERSMHRSVMLIFFIAGSIAIGLLSAEQYGNAYTWCWIPEKHLVSRVICYEVILFSSWLICFLVFSQVSTAIDQRSARASITSMNVDDMLTSNGSIQQKLVLYLGSFVFVWFFAMLNRIVEYAVDGAFFPTAFLTALILPLQGLINAMIYGDLLNISTWIFATKELGHHWKIFHRESLHEITVPAAYHDKTSLAESNLSNFLRTGYLPKQYSLFISTFNMGEAPCETIADDIRNWVVAGHDVYAIGLQECVDLANCRELIWKHLGGPTEYSMFTTEIGSGNTRLGYHGFIALTVFVKCVEIEQGNITATRPTTESAATGTDLIITTAQNKGAVGIPLQIHDTNIGFVTCHLPSDSKGKSKLSKRNASAHAILKDVILAPEDQGFDLHLQHDHIFVFGDLNYRMDTTQPGDGVNSLTGVAVACTIEKNALSDDSEWLARKYNLLRHRSDRLYPSIQELQLLKEALKGSRGAWSSVLRADELRAIIDDGDAFCGFEEPMPCFPPSYKRKKGKTDGDCGDYTDFAMILKGYSNTGTVENLLEVKQNHVQNMANTAASSAVEMAGAAVEMTSNVMKKTTRILSTRLTRSNSDSNQVDSIDYKHKSIDVNLLNTTINPMLELKQQQQQKERESLSQQDMNDRESISMSRESESNTRTSFFSSSGNKKSKPIINIDDPAKLRPPSYTDRILIHSLQDRKQRLTVQAYDFCDSVRASDHRAVSMTVLLEVNSSVYYSNADAVSDTLINNIQDENTSSNTNSTLNKRKSYSYRKSTAALADSNSKKIIRKPTPKFELYEVRVTDIIVTLNDIKLTEEESDMDELYRDSQVGDGDEMEVDFDRLESAQKTGSVRHGRSVTSLVAGASSAAAVGTGSSNTSSNNSSIDDTLASSSPMTKKKKNVRVRNTIETIPDNMLPHSEMEGNDEHDTDTDGNVDVDHKKIVDDSDATSTMGGGSDVDDIEKQQTTTAPPPPPRPSSTNSSQTSNSPPAPLLRKSSSKRTSFFTSFRNSFIGGGNSADDVDESEDDSTNTTNAVLVAAKPARKRSLFVRMFTSSENTSSSSTTASSSTPVTKKVVKKEITDTDILKEISNESLTYSTTNQSNEPNIWRKKVLDEQRREQQHPHIPIHIPKIPKKSTLLKKIIKRQSGLTNSNGTTNSNSSGSTGGMDIHNVVVVFPLPSKDPLLAQRKVYDVAKSLFTLNTSSNSSSDNTHTTKTITSNDGGQPPVTQQINSTVETTTSTTTTTITNEDSTSTTTNTNTNTTMTLISKEDLLKPFNSFLWKHRSVHSNIGDKKVGRDQTVFTGDITFQVKGCISAELGAHVLLKFTNKSGKEFGSCVVCLSHLIHRDADTIRSCTIKEIPLTSGGQKRGSLEGKFSLRFIPSPLSPDHEHHQKQMLLLQQQQQQQQQQQLQRNSSAAVNKRGSMFNVFSSFTSGSITATNNTDASAGAGTGGDGNTTMWPFTSETAPDENCFEESIV